MTRPRAKGNLREDVVQALFAENGRYAIVQRGSGSKGTKQQLVPNRVAGDVVVLPRPWQENFGIQIEVGGPGKRFEAEFADLRAAAVPGYALVLAIFAGMKPKRWLLADDDGGWTECSDFTDLLGTIEARS